MSSGVKPKLDDDGIDGEAYPECDAEELVRAEMGSRAGGEEEPHYGTGSCDSKQNGDGPGHPFPFWSVLAMKAEPVGATE